jgi:hypothetical protein
MQKMKAANTVPSVHGQHVEKRQLRKFVIQLSKREVSRRNAPISWASADGFAYRNGYESTLVEMDIFAMVSTHVFADAWSLMKGGLSPLCIRRVSNGQVFAAGINMLAVSKGDFGLLKVPSCLEAIRSRDHVPSRN